MNLDLKNIDTELKELSKKQSEALKYLNSKDIVKKYKTVSQKLIKLESQKLHYEGLRDLYIQYNKIKSEWKALNDKLEKNAEKIKKSIDNNNLIYKGIRLEFNRIIKDILNKEGVISVRQNKEGNLEFNINIENSQGDITSEDDGHTYKKLLCMAFDIAINNVYKYKYYSHFIFHDGAFETLDDRKKILFLKELRGFSENNQYIMTIIDSDFPDLNKDTFTKNEVILTLHDDGNDGRLFKMKEW